MKVKHVSYYTHVVLLSRKIVPEATEEYHATEENMLHPKKAVLVAILDLKKNNGCLL